MKKEYDFSKGKKNPYSKNLKKQVTIRINDETIEYFKAMAEESGISYQNMMNLVLQDCVENKKKPKIKWRT